MQTQGRQSRRKWGYDIVRVVFFWKVMRIKHWDTCEMSQIIWMKFLHVQYKVMMDMTVLWFCYRVFLTDYTLYSKRSAWFYFRFESR